MEDVLDLDAADHTPEEPLVCIDEASKQLIDLLLATEENVRLVVSEWPKAGIGGIAEVKRDRHRSGLRVQSGDELPNGLLCEAGPAVQRDQMGQGNRQFLLLLWRT